MHPRQFAARGRAGQFAPGGGELRSRLYEPLAHVRGGGYLPGKHAAWQRRTIRAFGSWSPVGTVQDRPSRQARRSLRSCSSGPSAHVRGPVLGLSIRALMAARLRLRLCEPPAHVHGGVPPLSSRAHGSSLSLVLIKRLAHVRGGLHPGQFAPMAARCRSCSSGRQRTCAAQCLNSQDAPMAARFARAHQETSARPAGVELPASLPLGASGPKGHSSHR